MSVWSKYSPIADFVYIYIVEAHPTDGWYLYPSVCHKEPTTIEERIELAKDLNKKFVLTHMQESTSASVPVLVDTMKNTASESYFAWPERLWIVQDGKVVYKGGIGPDNYHPEEVATWLSKYEQDLEKYGK